MKLISLKRIALLLLVFLIIGVANATSQSAPGITFAKCFGGSLPLVLYTSDSGRCIQQTKDGGYIIIGTTESNNGDVTGNHGLEDIWVLKLRNDGTLDWQKCLGGSQIDRGYSIQQTKDGGYILIGETASLDGDVKGNHGDGSGLGDIWVVKLKKNGSIDWQKCLGGSSWDVGYSIQQTVDEGYILCGMASSNDGDLNGTPGTGTLWVVKLRKSGEIDWQKRLGGNGGDSPTIGFSIHQTKDNGYILTGQTAVSGDIPGDHGNGDVWVVKLDKNGELMNQKCLGGSGIDSGRSIQQTNDGGYILTGSTWSNDGDVTGYHNGFYDLWVVKLRKDLSIDWQNCFGGSNWDLGWSVQQTKDGGYILGGDAGSTDGDLTGTIEGMKAWVLLLDKNGSLLWQKCIGGPSDGAYCVQQTDDTGYVITGRSASPDGEITGHQGSWDVLVVKLNGTAKNKTK